MMWVLKMNYVSKNILNIINIMRLNFQQYKLFQSLFQLQAKPKGVQLYQHETRNYVIFPGSQIRQWSLQLLQVTFIVLCECFLQTGFLNTSQHCFTLLVFCFNCLQPFPIPNHIGLRCDVASVIFTLKKRIIIHYDHFRLSKDK